MNTKKYKISFVTNYEDLEILDLIIRLKRQTRTEVLNNLIKKYVEENKHLLKDLDKK